MTDEHRYQTRLVWQGSTGEGYRSYPRAHTAVAPPAVEEVRLSSDPHFRGDPDLLNPEQLVLMAASSCQLLSFLATAARHHVDVVGYEDDAVAVMPVDAVPMRITRIALSPQIVVAAGTDVELVERLVQEAHHDCYVASSLSSDVSVTPTIVVR